MIEQDYKETARRDAETLEKLVGKTVVQLMEQWDEFRKLFRKYYDIKKISSVELEIDPIRCVWLKFSDGTSQSVLNMDQLDKFDCKIGDYGSIREYLEDKGFAAFDEV